VNADTESRLGRTAARTGTSTRRSTVSRYTNTRTRTRVVADGVFFGRRAARRVSTITLGTIGWFRDTVTPAGWLLIVGLVGGVALGLTAGLVEAWVIAAIAAVLLVFSAPFLLGSHDYRISLVLDRDRVVAGTEVAGHLDITNRSARVALPGLVDIPVGGGLVEAHVPLLLGGAEHREQLTISARRRGIIDVGPMTIARGDPVGILRRELVWPGIQRIFVHPVTVPIPSTSAGLVRDLEGMPTKDIVDSDLSFHAIREYVAGDSQKHIHWRSTAKTGKLMVRQYEESRRSRIALVLGLNDEEEYDSDDEFEMAVSALASLGAQGIRDGRDVLVSASAEIPEIVRREVQSIRTLPTITAKAMLDAAAQIEMSPRALRMEDVAKLTVQSHPDLSIAFLVTGSRLPLTRLRSAALAFSTQVKTVAVRCEPGAEPSFHLTQELSIMTIGALHDLQHMMARGALD
jgi:uncharacterized protein (DUF58 family)